MSCPHFSDGEQLWSEETEPLCLWGGALDDVQLH